MMPWFHLSYHVTQAGMKIGEKSKMGETRKARFRATKLMEEGRFNSGSDQNHQYIRLGSLEMNELYLLAEVL